MTLRTKYVCLLCTLLLGLSLNSKAQTLVRKTQQFSSVYYQYPVQFLRNGFKSGVEFNMNEKFNLGIQLNGTYSYNPIFFNSPGNQDGVGIDLVITPNYYMDNNVKIAFKNYITNYSHSFHGFYAGLSLQTGLVRESYYSSLGQFFPKTFVVNAYRYNRYAFMVGRQWTLYNQGVIDFNIGVGFNKMDQSAEMKFTALPPFHIHKNAAFFSSELAFGIGRITMDQSLPRKPRLSDSLILDHALLLDFNAVMNSGIELNLLHHNNGNHLWRNYVRVRNLKSIGLNITEADSFHSVMVGMQYRHYPTSSRYRNGVYFGYGYSYEHSIGYFSKLVGNHGEQTEVLKKVIYDPHHLDVTIGFTTIISHKFILDAYVSNILTLSKRRGAESFPRINDATGFRTEVGFKMGVARFRRK
ncbi:MAG: hypothetical protein ACI8SE_002183 [Bacteroidia bacterium]|jgi:hypothetical protein